jgi:hypothetical protein
MAKDGEPELWIELPELASEEQDPKKVLLLVAEIQRLLDNKDKGAAAKDLIADVSPEIARLLEQRKVPLKNGSTKPDIE